jgi:hypothetical protein
VHYYGAIAEKFIKRSKYLESIIIKTEEKFGLPPYIVTSPTFKNSNEFRYRDMLNSQLTIPLQKAIDFSIDKPNVNSYGVHMSLILRKSEDIFENGKFLCDNLLGLLERITLCSEFQSLFSPTTQQVNNSDSD